MTRLSFEERIFAVRTCFVLIVEHSACITLLAWLLGWGVGFQAVSLVKLGDCFII